MKNNYYVVFKGNHRGIFRDWETEARPSVEGYPGAKVLGFKTLEEAEMAQKLGYEEYKQFQQEVESKKLRQQQEDEDAFRIDW